MRLLLVGNHWTPGPGGAETMLVLTEELLTDAGHEVVPFALAEERTLPTPAADLLPRWAKDEARTGLGEALAGLWSRQAGRALEAALVRHRPDVAHVHHVFEGLTLAVLAALHRHRVPVVMTLHDYRPVCPNFRLFRDGAPCTRCLDGRYARVVVHRCLEGSRWRSVAAAAEGHLARRRGWYDDVAAFVSPSRFLRDRVVEGGLPVDRVRVLPNPVPLPDRAGEPATPPYVAFTGRLVEEKGIRVLLDAAARLPDGVHVKALGSGRLAEEVADRVARDRLPVDLLGLGTPADAAALLRGASAAVLPSLWWENCPMAVLEAAALGVPVVASAVGGLPELVEDGVTGRLVPPGDAPALAGALSAVVTDPAAARRLGAAARERVRLRHDPGAHVGALLEVYDTARRTVATSLSSA